MEATDYYIRVRPKDSLEFASLMNSGLEFFDYPLDYDILVEGDYYHDPSIPEDEITWQYTVVKPNTIQENVSYETIAAANEVGDYAEVNMVVTDKKKLVKCELIDVCYIPREDVITKSGKSVSVSAEELESMALALSHLPDKYVDPETKGLFSSSYYPTGRVYVEDYDFYSKPTKVGELPIKHVKVRSRFIVKWDSAYTDDNGYYRISTKYSANPHMSIVFENSNDFIIWGNWAFLAPASYCMGYPDRSVELSKTISHSSSAWKWAAINNAATDYYSYCRSNIIKTPPTNLKIWSLGWADWSSAPMLWHIKGFKLASGAVAVTAYLASCPLLAGISASATIALSVALPDLFIGTYGHNGESNEKVKAVVYHELSHSSHYSKVGEAVWGPYIEHIVTSWDVKTGECYGDGTRNDAKQRICELGEMWGYSNQRMIGKNYGKDDYGSTEWFAPAIKSLYNLLDNNTITTSQAYNCLTATTKNVDTFVDNLANSYKSNAYEIVKSFVDNKALANQTLWQLTNSSSSLINVSTKRDGKISSVDVYSGGSITLGQMHGYYQGPTAFITSPLYYPDELSIFVYKSGTKKELFHSIGCTITKDLTRSFSQYSNWRISSSTNKVGSKTSVTNEYEILSSDI